MKRLLLGIGVAGLIMAMAPPVQAQQRRLRVADSFPSGHFLVRFLIQPWMEEVTRRTNGQVAFDHFPSQQLGKAADMLTLTQTGVADIGYVAPAYISDKMPVSEVAMLPGSFSTSCEGTRAYIQTARNGIVAAQDYRPNRIRLLLAVALPPYQILTVRAPIRSQQDLAGLKLRSTGGAQDLTLRAIGATPMRMAAPESYEALSRGTLDGVLFPLDSVLAYNIEKLVRHSTTDANFASFIVAYSISDNVWNRLPAPVQQAMTEAADQVNASACAAVERQEAETRAKLEAAGVQFMPLPDAYRSQVAEQLAGVSDQWARSLDARGKKGTEALAEFRSLLRRPTQ